MEVLFANIKELARQIKYSTWLKVRSVKFKIPVSCPGY
jgi:hypothetical protein